MSAFVQQAGAFLASFDVEYAVEPPFVHFAQRRLSFHLVELEPSLYPAFFQDLSIRYEQRGIRLVHLWEDVYVRQTPLAQSRICALLGNSERIFARNTEVRRIDQSVLNDFLNIHHLQGSTQAKYKYGLFHEGVLMAVASFSAVRPLPRNGKMHQSYELIRFANRSGYTVTGGLSKLLNAFIAEVRPDDIMTYADRDWSIGQSYEQLGFTCVADTPPQAFLVHPQSMVRYYPHRLPEGRSREELLPKGYITIYNAGNKKYLSLQNNY
ncbi:MAG: hypothetical protein FWH23_07730 [Bacteroidales bacterium]|nr:hypothetical protein [Bacteroidales bacterium]MCL2133826.1 hypothetical protein [Bacteroidales bacterium]